MEKLLHAIGHEFRNPAYLEIALTHSSYANERRGTPQNNERQEFLGDAVLSVIVADYIFRHRKVAEGELTKIRASLVCEGALAGFARQISLGECLRLGRGEEQNGGRERPSILADAFEALIAAVYLDGGLEAARRFVLPFIADTVEHAAGTDLHDYKTQLQEVVQQNPEERVGYVLTGEHGPDHDKWFEVEVHLNSNVIGKGGGRSKKAAEQQAAREALLLRGVVHDEK
ncbi:MAG: ribonuclease III [Oscillospiraceae bacterium]